MSLTTLRRLRDAIVLVVVLVVGVVVWQVRYGDPPPVYFAEFANASELVVHNDVRVNDVVVGKVTGIALDGYVARVAFSVAQEVDLGTGTRAEIRQASLLGEKYIALIPDGTGDLRPGETIPLEATRRANDLETVTGQGVHLASALGADAFNRIFYALDAGLVQDEGQLDRLLAVAADAAATFDRADLDTTIDAIDRLANSLEPNADEMGEAVARAVGGLQALARNDEELASFTASLDDLSETMQGLLGTNREKLLHFGDQLNQVLGEATAVLPEVDRGIAALYDFNAAWSCIGDGHFLNQTFVLIPEAATIDYGPGDCDPEIGQRSRDNTTQVVIPTEPPSEGAR